MYYLIKKNSFNIYIFKCLICLNLHTYLNKHVIETTHICRYSFFRVFWVHNIYNEKVIHGRIVYTNDGRTLNTNLIYFLWFYRIVHADFKAINHPKTKLVQNMLMLFKYRYISYTYWVIFKLKIYFNVNINHFFIFSKSKRRYKYWTLQA